jgi:undecaprenyl-diphosphatase
MEQLLRKFDDVVIAAVQSWPHWMKPVFYVATIIGHPVLTVGVGVVTMSFGFIYDRQLFTYVGGVVIVTVAVGSLLKLMLRRRRPLTEYVQHMRFRTYSFPSGHSLGATIAYGMLAYVAPTIIAGWMGMGVSVLLMLLVILVGISRVYLGAHYPSDVLAGWLLGGIGLAGIIMLMGAAS